MAPTDTTRRANDTREIDSDTRAVARVEASAGASDRAPLYVDSVLHELRQVVARARCPAHDCGPTLTVDFASRDEGSLNVIAHNCCPRLDKIVARALRVYPLFRLQISSTT